MLPEIDFWWLVKVMMFDDTKSFQETLKSNKENWVEIRLKILLPVKPETQKSQKKNWVGIGLEILLLIKPETPKSEKENWAGRALEILLPVKPKTKSSRLNGNLWRSRKGGN